MLVMIDVYDHGTPCRTAATIVPQRSVSWRLPANLASRSSFWKKTVAGSLPIFMFFIIFFVLFLARRVPEHGLEFEDEVVPMQVSISRASGVSIVVDPKSLRDDGSTSLWRV